MTENPQENTAAYAIVWVLIALVWIVTITAVAVVAFL